MTRVPWALILGALLLGVSILVLPLVEGYGREGSPSIRNTVGLQAFLGGAAVAAIVAEAAIRGYQWYLYSSLTRVAAALPSESVALLVFAEWSSPRLPSAMPQGAIQAKRAWLHGFPFVLVASPADLTVRSPSRVLFSFAAPSIDGLVLVKKPGRRELAFRLVLNQSLRAPDDADEFIEFFWVEIRSGLLPVKDNARIEEMQARLEGALFGQRPAGEFDGPANA